MTKYESGKHSPFEPTVDSTTILKDRGCGVTLDYLENVPNIAATVCDKEGVVLYQNKRFG